MSLTPEQEKKLKETIGTKEWRINNLYFIKDKNARKIKFKRNKDQLRYNQERHNRNINLKARQIGFTTDACIDSLDDALFNSYFDVGIIADDIDNAKSIFVNKVKFAYDNLPDLIKKIRPAKTDREGELRFNNGSSISVDTSFRGGTLRRLHVSEFGKISIKYPKKALEIITGAFEAVPLDGRIDVESTAEGMSGAFYEMCSLAMGKASNKSTLTPLDFKFHFAPWFTSDEYRIDPNGVLIPDRLNKYFDYLENAHGIQLDAHQKAWYTKKEEQQKALMKQEYPSYPAESFMNSGRPVFDQEQVTAAILRAEKKEFTRGRFLNGKFVSDDYGPYKIFKKYEEGRKFCVGADVAEGLESGDFSAMFGLNKNLEQVFSYHNHTHPDLFGFEMVQIGKVYGEALLAPEVNNHGLTTLTHITNAHYPYLYMRKVLDERTNEMTDKAGWHTNVKTKPMMLDEFIAAFRDNLIQINDVDTLREMLTITYEANGAVNLNGKDRVVAGCIALQAIKQVHEIQVAVYDNSEAGTTFRAKTLSEMLQYQDEIEESSF